MSPEDSPDLADRGVITTAYLQALGLDRRPPGWEFLRQITRHHVASWAFSSLGPRLGADLPLDLASLYRRIVVQARGGYCFEHNGLLFEVLQELGFSVHLALARVIYNQDTHPGLTHRVTLVELGGQRQVVDVGFGPLGPREPVPLSGQDSVQGPGRFRVCERRPGELHLQTLKDGAWFSLYRFDLSRYGQADCELGHFWSHRHPTAAFVNHLVVSRILDDEVRSLRNRDYWVLGGAQDQRHTVEDAAHLQAILQGELGLRVTPQECADLMARMA